MDAKKGLEIGREIAEGLTRGLESVARGIENFKAGERQVKGVPLDLQLFTDEDPIRESNHYVVDGDKAYISPPPISLEEAMKIPPIPYGKHSIAPLPFDGLEAHAHAFAMSGIQKVYNEDQMDLEDYKELVDFQKEEIGKLEKKILESGKEIGKLMYEKENLERERELWKKVTFLLCDETLKSKNMDR